MARLAGVDLPRNKRMEIALTYIVGIGKPTAGKILAKAGIDPNMKSDDLTEENIGAIRRVIDSGIAVEGDVRRLVSRNIKRHMDLGTWRGLRHRRGLPVRGQRTKTNARTRKGRIKKTVVGKKKAPRK